MADRRSFFARLGALVGGLALAKDRKVALDRLSAVPKKPTVVHGSDLRIEANGRQVYPADMYDPHDPPRPARGIRIVRRGPPSRPPKLHDEFDVYVDCARVGDVVRFDCEAMYWRSWSAVTVVSLAKTKGVEPDQERYVGPWIEYVYYGYLA